MKAWRITLERGNKTSQETAIRKATGSRLGAWAMETKGESIFLNRTDQIF